MDWYLYKDALNVGCCIFAVANSETHYSLPNCVHIHYFFSISIQQVSMGITFFCIVKFNGLYTLLYFMAFWHSLAAMYNGANTIYGLLVGRFSLCCHTTNIYSDVVGQHNQIGGITFGVFQCMCVTTDIYVYDYIYVFICMYVHFYIYTYICVHTPFS